MKTKEERLEERIQKFKDAGYSDMEAEVKAVEYERTWNWDEVTD